MASRWSEYDAPSVPQSYPPQRQYQQSSSRQQSQGLSPYSNGPPPPSRQWSGQGDSYANPSYSSQSFHSPRTEERNPFADSASPRSAHAHPRSLEDYPSAAPDTGRGYDQRDVPTASASPRRASRLPFGLGGGGGASTYNAGHWNAAALEAKKGGRTTAIIAVLVLLALIAGGVTAGVVIHNKNASSKSSSGDGTTATSSGLTQNGDPSQFPKDGRLKRSFYGFAYTPLGSQVPWCGVTIGNVTEDMQIMSQLTKRIHMYGADCNQSSLVLDAIAQTKVDMSVWLGIYVTDNETDFTRQLDATVSALQAFGAAHVEGVIVGNEYILNADPKNNNNAAVNQAIEKLSTWMTTTRTTLAGLNLGKTIPVGTADAGSKMSANLADNTDFLMANVHPYFGGVPIEEAAVWTYGYYEDPVVLNVQKATNQPNQPVYIAETGWPTEAMAVGPLHDGGAYPSIANLQTFLDTYVCQANANGTLYFFFEAFDEPWKEQYGGVEPYWGLFDASKKLKDIKIPDCPAP